MFALLMALWFDISVGQDLIPIQNHLGTVETGKSTFRQELRSLDDGLVQYTAIEVDTKGREKETQYIFGFADIDKNTVRALTKKDVIVVQLLVSGKQKLVKMVTNGGDKVSYTDKLQLFAKDSENGNHLEKQLKEFIPQAIDQEEKRLSLTTYQEHVNWLLDNIGDLELPSQQISQKITTDEIPGKIVLEQIFNAKNKTKTQIHQLNLSTLNANSVGYRISGEEFTITVDTRRNIKGIKYNEDGQQKNYVNTIRLYATSISNGKDIYRVLKATIPLAKVAFENSRPDVSSIQKSLTYLNSVVSEISTTEGNIVQNITIQDNVAQLKQEIVEPDKSAEYFYRFNFSDINSNNIDYDGQKDLLFTILPTKKTVKFIQTIKNGELQNYTDSARIFFTSIEDAIVGTEAVKVLANLQEQKMAAITYESPALSEAVQKLQKLMQKVKIGEDTYDLYIELINTKTNTIKITSVFSNLKKSIETIQEFGLNDINPKNCKITVKGKHVLVELNTNHLEKIIKTYVDGEIKPYQHKAVIEAKGIEEARQIVGIINSIIPSK